MDLSIPVYKDLLNKNFSVLKFPITFGEEKLSPLMYIYNYNDSFIGCGLCHKEKLYKIVSTEVHKFLPINKIIYFSKFYFWWCKGNEKIDGYDIKSLDLSIIKKYAIDMEKKLFERVGKGIYATKIQRTWKRCITNIKYKVCRDRLLKEFREIQQF